jgi:hypothetical protein
MKFHIEFVIEHPILWRVPRTTAQLILPSLPIWIAGAKEGQADNSGKSVGRDNFRLI